MSHILAADAGISPPGPFVTKGSCSVLESDATIDRRGPSKAAGEWRDSARSRRSAQVGSVGEFALLSCEARGPEDSWKYSEDQNLFCDAALFGTHQQKENGSAISVTRASPKLRRARIARLVGSASAMNV